jgi:hypothetical protein
VKGENPNLYIPPMTIVYCGSTTYHGVGPNGCPGDLDLGIVAGPGTSTVGPVLTGVQPTNMHRRLITNHSKSIEFFLGSQP